MTDDSQLSRHLDRVLVHGQQPTTCPTSSRSATWGRVVEPGHRCLARADPQEPATNVHVYAAGDEAVARYLRFRDRLQGDLIREILARADRTP